MLNLNNSYATRAIPAATIGSNFGGPLTMVVTFRTKSTIPAGGVFVIGIGTQNQYTGFRIVAGGVLEAGMRTVSGLPVTIATLSPNTIYTAVLTRDNTGNSSITLNGGAAVTSSVSAGAVTYNYYAVGSYWNSSYISTTLLDIAHAGLYRRQFNVDEIAAYHAKNLGSIATTSLFDYHSLVSDLDSDAGGTALVMNTGTASFDDFDPFAPLYTITPVNGGNPVIPGQAATWTATGFAPNSATLDGIACLSVSSLGFTPPGYADEASNPRPGSRLLVASEGANTASATVPVGVIPGYKYQTLASVSASLYSVVKDMDADIGDFVAYPDADGNNVTDAGELETNHEGSQVFWLIKGDTGYGLSYNVSTGPGGEIIDVIRSLTAKSLTMSGLTMRSLTARGL